MKFVVAILLLLADISSPAMDRFAALSMVESGDNDRAIGPEGEVSRYQITRDNWKAFSAGEEQPTDSRDALAVTSRILRILSTRFERRHGRPPTNPEWYLLWHCPARVNHPTVADRDLAQRFSNLCSK